MKSFLFLFLISFSAITVFSQDTLVENVTIKDTVIFSSMPFSKFKQLAAFENKPYFLMFSASWCAPCHRIKKELFTNSQISTLANENYLAYFVDIESFDGLEINNQYQVNQLPTILFFDPRGKQTDKAIGFFDGYYIFKKFRAHVPPNKRGEDWKNTEILEEQ